MKAQYVIHSSRGGDNSVRDDIENRNASLLRERNNDNNADPVRNQVTNNRGGFTAFQGRGTAVGSN